MRYAQLRQYDVANGPGIRTSFFVTGCTIGCKDCFNEAYQDFAFGQPWTDQVTAQVLAYLAEDMVDGLTILGGEPFDNKEDLVKILEEIRQHSTKSIWIYSGYTWERLVQDATSQRILELADVLVDGPFVAAKKNLRLRFRGSSNQRIIDLKKTGQGGPVVNFYKDE